jgi:uncharacterized membrane protein YhaH (DUF805 family)
VNMVDAVKHGFSNYARFSGRARRSEFWFWTLFTFLVSIVASVLDRVLGTGFATQYGESGGVVQTITSLALLVPGLAVSWRRLHDIGRSGAWYLTLLIPLANIVFFVILIVWACKDSQPGQNQHGPNPKGFGGGYGEFPGQPPQFGGPSQYGQPGQF